MSLVMRNGTDASALLDRRRRQHADLAEQVLHRVDLLEPEDRALLESVYGDDLPISRLAAVRLESPRRVRRRVRRLVERLMGPQTAFVIARRHDWGAERWEVARKCLIAGCNLRRASRDLGLSLHRVRKHLDAVRTLIDDARTER